MARKTEERQTIPIVQQSTTHCKLIETPRGASPLKNATGSESKKGEQDKTGEEKRWTYKSQYVALPGCVEGPPWPQELMVSTS